MRHFLILFADASKSTWRTRFGGSTTKSGANWRGAPLMSFIIRIIYANSSGPGGRKVPPLSLTISSLYALVIKWHQIISFSISSPQIDAIQTPRSGRTCTTKTGLASVASSQRTSTMSCWRNAGAADLGRRRTSWIASRRPSRVMGTISFIAGIFWSTKGLMKLNARARLEMIRLIVNLLWLAPTPFPWHHQVSGKNGEEKTSAPWRFHFHYIDVCN